MGDGRGEFGELFHEIVGVAEGHLVDFEKGASAGFGVVVTLELILDGMTEGATDVATVVNVGFEGGDHIADGENELGHKAMD